MADSLKLSQNIAISFLKTIKSSYFFNSHFLTFLNSIFCCCIYGVTFLAFGNGASDVFSAIAAVGNAKDGDAGLAFGALFGAGVFISTVIVGCICLIAPFQSVQRPFLRDLIFFMIAGFWAFFVVWDGKIELWETLSNELEILL